MVNLFDLLTTTGNKITNASNTLFDKLGPDSTPQLDTIQLGDDGNIDTAQSLHLQNRVKPLTPKESLFGRTLEENIQTINPENNSAEMTTIRDYRPGLFSDIASGYNENRNNAISMNNFGNNTLSDGRRKGFAYRLGEGLGSLARIGDSPLGRSLLIGGLVGATGGSGLDALVYGAQTGMLNQSNRLRDQAYRNSLEDQGLDTSNLRGYMTDSTYKNILDAKTLQDNAAWRKMYFDAQQQQNEISRILAQEKFEYQKRQDAIENAMGWAKLKNKPGRILTTGASDGLSATAQGVEQMNTLKDKISKLPKRAVTPGIAQAAKLNPFDTDVQAFNQYVKTYKQVIGKGLEGGVLRKEDEYKYDQIIPKLGDTTAVLNKKAQQLHQMLVNKYNTDLDFYGRAGYDISGFDTMSQYWGNNNTATESLNPGYAEGTVIKNKQGKRMIMRDGQWQAL